MARTIRWKYFFLKDEKEKTDEYEYGYSPTFDTGLNNQTASAPSAHEALNQIIGSHMGCSKILTFLTRHGCADLTSFLH
ncbi:hypothetical protein RSOLAG1IB_10513 [Rhizoctonia solani AG-1 IB]|uniref:Uncharacterized protein n=1 Tax=Thanatephorus cucumeris (strain AG1-IB / isolate 7/3/14) TaxID=1108050 RepID=A0A0B7G304_THACB|nr:hypothetical protein RSOLAG1IB_10513 [Rhizoctonia solani AG-1 IB]